MSGAARWDGDQGQLALDGLGVGTIGLVPHLGVVTRERPDQIQDWSGEDPRATGEGLGWEGPGFRLALRVTRDADGFLVRGTLEATRPLQLAHLGFSLSTELLAAPDGLRFFRHGYASWSPSASFPWDQPPRRPLAGSFAVANHYIDGRWWEYGRGMASHGFGVLTRDGVGLLVGWLTEKIGLAQVFLADTRPPFLIATLDFGGRELGWGEAIELEPLRVAAGPEQAVLERYADEAARENGVDLDVLRVRPAPVGWCSWYHFYTRVRPEDVARNAAALAAMPWLGLDLVQLDDGYQTAVGDWRSMNAKFAAGLAGVAAEIAGHGYKPGLWTAPFMAGRRSRLIEEHPEFVLRDRDGEPIDCGLNPLWMDRLVGLDLSHPGAQGWLGELFRGLRADGFTFFKLDFLYAALRHAARHDPKVSPVESYRIGLRVIREAVGADAFLLGCGAPMLASVGLVDGMRVSGDVKEAWGTGLLGLFGSDCGAPSLKESARNNVTRAFLHRRWWLNDPDCLLVRDRKTSLDQDEVRLLATVAGMTGGLGIVSDDMEAVSEDRRALLAFVLPPTPLRPVALDLFQRPFPERFVLEGGDRRLVAELNWEDRPAERRLPALAVWRFDAWQLTPLPAGALSVPRHGVRAFWETPQGDHPRLIGTSLHLTALLDGRITERWEGERLHLGCPALPRPPGRLWLAVPAGWRLERVEGPARAAGEGEGVLALDVEAGPWAIALDWRRG